MTYDQCAFRNIIDPIGLLQQHMYPELLIGMGWYKSYRTHDVNMWMAFESHIIFAFSIHMRYLQS